MFLFKIDSFQDSKLFRKKKNKYKSYIDMLAHKSPLAHFHLNTTKFKT